MKLTEIAWTDFKALDLHAKGELFKQGGNPYHVIIAQQFDRSQLDALGTLATQIRLIAKDQPGLEFLGSVLRGRRAMLYFTQPSTRTFLSFCAACQTLGLTLGEVRDPSTSSELKGETPEDSVRTFSSYFDIVVMRSQLGGLAERMAWVLSNSERSIPVVNAGSGKDQHPTQALLDVYTLQRSFERRGGVDGKTVVFCGDLLRGRTVRSLSWLLTCYDDVKQVFVAPPDLQVSDDVIEFLKQRNVSYELSDDFRSQIPSADAVYMTRIQDEWDAHKGDSEGIDISSFGFGLSELELLGPDSIIMHPLPRRAEIAREIDSDPRAMYWRQMRNGMWIRAALIASVFGRASMIREYYEAQQ